jgi:hypothetical protein
MVAWGKKPKGNRLSLGKDGLQVNNNAPNPGASQGCVKKDFG